jgi:hypothetical protein
MALCLLSSTDESVLDSVSRVVHDRVNLRRQYIGPTCALLHVSLSTGLLGVQFANGLSSRFYTDIPRQNRREVMELTRTCKTRLYFIPKYF